ncbi:MAG TPA: hypothetical protein VHE35_36410, partial [Kofleriaceae bacterium]|nr:hypothetical protein [Kofleriaceae bacterium]
MGDRAFALELWLDRREAALVPELAAHDRAALACALAGREPPPPPQALCDPAWLEAARRAVDVDDARLRRRAATLARWSLAARVAIEPAMRAALASGRDLAGLGRRYAALREAASRLGFADADALLAALHGA